MARNQLFDSASAYGLALFGDIPEATKWLSYSVGQLGGLLARQKGPTSLILKPTDSIEIRIDTRPNKISITASGLQNIFMDSGLLTAGSVNQFGGMPMLIDAKIWLTSKLAPNVNWGKMRAGSLERYTYPRSTATGLAQYGGVNADHKNKTVAQGQMPESCSLPLKDKNGLDLPLTALVDASGKDISDYTQALSAHKIQVRDYPASLWSGKLRLLVQAIYGREYPKTVKGFNLTADILSQGDSGLQDSALVGQMFQLTDNTGILTTSLYDYFFVEISIASGKINFMPITPYGIGLESSKWIKTSENRVSFPGSILKHESILFAHSYFDRRTVKEIPIANASIYTGGAPAYYGWHYKKDGKTADIVTHSQIPSVWGGAKAQHLRVTIVESIINGEYKFTASCAEVGHGDWQMMWKYSNFWVPMAKNANAGHTLIYPGIRDNPTPIDSNAPLYAFYDSDDALKVVQYVNTRNPNTVSTSVDDNMDPAGLFYPYQEQHHTVTESRSGRYTTSISCGDYAYVGVATAGESSTTNAIVHNGPTVKLIDVGRGEPSTLHPLPYPSLEPYPPATSYDFNEEVLVGTEIRRTTFSDGATSNAAILIPIGDCSSVYCLGRYTNISEIHEETKTGGIGMPYRSEITPNEQPGVILLPMTSYEFPQRSSVNTFMPLQFTNINTTNDSSFFLGGLIGFDGSFHSVLSEVFTSELLFPSVELGGLISQSYWVKTSYDSRGVIAGLTNILSGGIPEEVISENTPTFIGFS